MPSPEPSLSPRPRRGIDRSSAARLNGSGSHPAESRSLANTRITRADDRFFAPCREASSLPRTPERTALFACSISPIERASPSICRRGANRDRASITTPASWLAVSRSTFPRQPSAPTSASSAIYQGRRVSAASSALVVGIASALIRRGRLEDRVEWRGQHHHHGR
jgi:hypothetical protein